MLHLSEKRADCAHSEGRRSICETEVKGDCASVQALYSVKMLLSGTVQEMIDGKEYLSFRGENVNGVNLDDRTPDPNRLLSYDTLSSA